MCWILFTIFYIISKNNHGVHIDSFLSRCKAYGANGTHIYRLAVSACCLPRNDCPQQKGPVAGPLLVCFEVVVSPVAYGT